MKFSTRTNIWMITTNTGMSYYLRKSTRNFQEENYSPNLYTYQLCRNGDPWVFSNQEDGFTMNYTDLNLTFCFSEDLKDQTLKQDYHLLDLLLLLILLPIEMILH